MEIEDSVRWENVRFEISQGDRIWKTRLQTEDYFNWWTKMQLYELNCYGEVEYGVAYE